MKRRFDPSKWQLRFGGLFVIVIYLGTASFIEHITDDPYIGITYGYIGGLIPLIVISIYIQTRLKKTTEESLSQADKDFDLKPDMLASVLAFAGAFLFVHYFFDLPLNDVIMQTSFLAGGAVLSFIFYIIRMKGKGYQLEDGHWIKKEEEQKEHTD